MRPMGVCIHLRYINHLADCRYGSCIIGWYGWISNTPIDMYRICDPVLYVHEESTILDCAEYKMAV